MSSIYLFTTVLRGPTMLVGEARDTFSKMPLLEGFALPRGNSCPVFFCWNELPRSSSSSLEISDFGPEAAACVELRCVGVVWCGAARQKLAESSLSNESIRLQKSIEQIGAELRSSVADRNLDRKYSMPLFFRSHLKAMVTLSHVALKFFRICP